jgi:phosphoglycerate dehydrogenase-like enzyme
MKLLYTEFSQRFVDAIAQRLARLDPPVTPAPLGEEPSEMLLVGMRLSDDELERALSSGVSWIQAAGAGIEHVLTPALVASPVTLTNAGGSGADPIAEFVLARMLEHAKKLRELAALQASRTWKTTWTADMAGATALVVGLGPIGRRIAELCKAFGMRVVGVRRRPEAGAGPCDEVRGPEALAATIPRADYVVLAPPLTAKTRGMFGAAEVAAMKDGALLVNVGRGDLVDEAALLEGLASGRFSAAVDVFETEPLPGDHAAWELAGLAISPHCSSLTPTLFEGLADFVADQVDRYVHGRPLKNVVDKSSGYPLPDEAALSGTS